MKYFSNKLEKRVQGFGATLFEPRPHKQGVKDSSELRMNLYHKKATTSRFIKSFHDFIRRRSFNEAKR